jgi:hypothetical protein
VQPKGVTLKVFVQVWSSSAGLPGGGMFAHLRSTIITSITTSMHLPAG